MIVEKTFAPVDRINGVLRPPGDKSISHRGVVLGGMAKGTTRVTGLAPGRDVAATIDCLHRLGVSTEQSDGGLVIEGFGWKVDSGADLEARNSGTTMRLLAGALAGRPAEFVITGDESLSKRPMDRVAEPLRRMGARVTLVDGRFPPLRLAGGVLNGMTYEMPVPSAQVKGATLLAAIQAEGTTRVLEAHPSRDHTERILQWLGVPISIEGETIIIEGGGLQLQPFDLQVPGDFSSASYALVSALLVDDGDLIVEGVGLNPSRTGLLEVLRQMGADFEIETQSADPEPVGTIRVRSSRGLKCVTLDADLVVRTIDELSLVALAATRAEGTTFVWHASELRVKEADRVAVLAQGLRTLGAQIDEAPDGFSVTGPTRLRGGRVDSKGDHRMALTFAAAGLIAQEPVTITGWEWSAVSYPSFESDLAPLLR